MVKIARKSNKRYDGDCDGRRVYFGIAGILLLVVVLALNSISVAINFNSEEGEAAVAGAAVDAVSNDGSSSSAAAITSSSSSSSSTPPAVSESESESVSYRTPLAYGTKSGKEKTGELVEQAIVTGFRHIVTGGHHEAHNESGVGMGWKHSGVPRTELFLQTCFVPFRSPHDFQRQPSDPEELELSKLSIEDQVHLSIQTSLTNLQTTYLDAMVFHNFRAKLWNYDEIIKAWRIFESYVNKGVIRQLGITSVHDPVWFEKFYNETTIKPTIVQNRFHSNRQYDIKMQDIFEKYDKIQVQRFWLLNGSSGMGRGNKDMAKAKGVTPEQLMLGFAMSLGSQTCLVGTKSLQHMKDDVEIMKCYPSLFYETMDTTDSERNEYAKKLGMKQQQFGNNQPLPGRGSAAAAANIDRRRSSSSSGSSSRTCQSTQ